jgi:hypothetical protein
VLLAIVILGVAFMAVSIWAMMQVVAAMRLAREDALRARTLQIVALFGPAVSAASDDPRQLLVWHPLASTARALCPTEFDTLDRAAGRRFPFDDEAIQAAHARWSADWLAWEHAHDIASKLKAAEADAAPDAHTSSGRAKRDAIEREKLAAYQRRYEEYARVSKGLQTLLNRPVT